MQCPSVVCPPLYGLDSLSILALLAFEALPVSGLRALPSCKLRVDQSKHYSMLLSFRAVRMRGRESLERELLELVKGLELDSSEIARLSGPRRRGRLVGRAGGEKVGVCCACSCDSFAASLVALSAAPAPLPSANHSLPSSPRMLASSVSSERHDGQVSARSIHCSKQS